MAEVKYKFGTDELDLLDYLNNLEYNVQSYINSKNWNDGLRLEFAQAYRKMLSAYQDLLQNNTGRFSTDSLGSITDTLGEFSNRDNDNIDPVGSEYYYDDKGNQITTDDYNTLKKRKLKNYNTFSANREVASFFNTVGKALAKARVPETSNNKKFTLADNGFEKWFNTKENPAGGDFDFAPYIEKDKLDEATGVRGTSERSKYLSERLLNYLANLEDLDYSESPYKSKETYAQKIKEAIDNLANGYNSEDTIALRLIGLSNDFINKFFAAGNTESLEERAKQASENIEKAKKEQEYQKVLDEEDKLKVQLELAQYIKDNPFESKYNGYLDDVSYDIVTLADEIESKYSDIEGEDNKVKAWLNFELLLNDIKNPILDEARFGKTNTKEGYENAMKMLRNNLALKLKVAAQEGYMKSYDGNKTYVIPGSEDYNNYSVITYNPTTGEIQHLSILLNEQLREAMAYDWYNKNREVPANKEGGIINYLQEGGLLQRARELRQQRLTQQAKLEQELKLKLELENKSTSGRTIDRAFGRSKELEVEGARKLSEGLEWDDRARLGAIALDLTSAISAFGIGAGTAASAATGVGSTLATFLADQKDGFLWSDLGTAGYGLGMDLVGLVPGFGTAGKVGKIAKNLVKFAPYVLGVLQAKDALSDPSRKSWDKLLSGKFKEITVDDLRNIASGVTLVASAGLLAGTRLKNTAMKKAAKTGDNLIEDKTGEMLRIPSKKLEAILKAKSLEEANGILLSIPGYENRELASKFRSNWNPARLWNNNPKVAEHYDWDKLRGTKFDKGSWSDADIFEKSRSSNLGHLEWHLDIKNPYSKYLETSSTNKSSSSTNKSNPSQKANPQLSKKRFDKVVEQGILEREKNDVINYWRSRYKRLRDMTNDQIWDVIQEQQKASKHKQGGTLNLAKVRKFQNSGKVTYTPTGRNGVRKKDSYTFDTSLRLKATLDRIKNGNMTVDDANQFLRRHYGMYSNWSQAPMLGGDISLYQTDYQGLGLNDEVIAPGFTNNYNIQSNNPTSGDTLKKWTIDGIYDLITDDRRVMARAADYEGNLDKLNSDIAAAKAAGYDYYLDPETLYYMLKPLELTTVKYTDLLKKPSELFNSSRVDVENPEEKVESQTPKTNIFSKLFANPTLTYGLPRAIYADRTNRRMTDMAKAAVTPLLKDPFDVHRYVRSDLDAEMLGERNYADLRSLASRPLTSDGSLQTASLLQAELLGLAARTAGKEKSNLTLRQYGELAWLLEKENAANRHDTAMFNRALMWGAALDKAKIELAYLSKKFNIWDTFLQLLEYDSRVKLKENKALADRFALLDAHTESVNNLAKYAPELSVEVLNIWNQVTSGNTTPSLLQNDPAKWQLYQLALRALQLAESELLRLHYGISGSPYGKVRLLIDYNTKLLPKRKRGGNIDSQIAIAGIKAKTADAERFQRQIKLCIDRNEKAIDRLSKSLYGIIKASILK